jgi:hypothetical protein
VLAVFNRQMAHTFEQKQREREREREREIEQESMGLICPDQGRASDWLLGTVGFSTAL